MNIEGRFNIRRGNFHLNVTFNIPLRGTTVIIGKSASGKTTLLRAIAGLDFQKGNTLKVGKEIWQDDEQFLPVHKRSLGYVFQNIALFPHLTVKKNLEFGYQRVSKEKRRIHFDDTVEKTGVKELLKRKIGGLSGGETQRIAITGALLTSPQILLMDEPLAALDIHSKNELLAFLENVTAEFNIPVFYITHSRDETVRLADYVFVMKDGGFIAQGKINDMFMNFENPLSLEWDAESVVDAGIEGYDAEYSLNRIKTPCGVFYVSGNPLPKGNRIKLRIPAKDVSLTLHYPERSSILNIFEATVADIKIDQTPYATVKLNANGVLLLSQITKKSAADLEIKVGMKLFAQIKGVSLAAAIEHPDLR